MPKPALSRNKIVDAAMQMAEEKGIESVTLRGVASRLGVHVTSLYNHIPTKQALLDEMVSALIAEADLPRDPATWQEWVEQFAVRFHKLATRRPGAIQAIQYGHTQETSTAEVFEAAFSAFRSDGFDAVASFCAIKSTFFAVLGVILEDTARARSPDYQDDMDLLPIEEFPHIHEIERTASNIDATDYLVQTLIDGFSANRVRMR